MLKPIAHSLKPRRKRLFFCVALLFVGVFIPWIVFNGVNRVNRPPGWVVRNEPLVGGVIGEWTEDYIYYVEGIDSPSNRFKPNAIYAVNEEDAAWVTSNRRLKRFRLSLCDVSQVEFEGFDGLDDLEELDFWDTNISDGHLAHFAQASSLEILTIANMSEFRNRMAMDDDLVEAVKHEYLNAELSGSGLKHISEMESLTHLGLINVPLKEGDWSGLAGMQNLRQLLLIDCSVPGEALLHIANLKQLEELKLTRNPIDVDLLKNLGELTHLKRLDLEDTSIGDGELKHIGALVGLESLYLSGNQITDRGLMHLSGMKQLAYLDLSGTLITDEGLRLLNGLDNLAMIYLEGSKITPEGLEALRRLPKLNSIVVGDDFKQKYFQEVDDFIYDSQIYVR